MHLEFWIRHVRGTMGRHGIGLTWLVIRGDLGFRSALGFAIHAIGLGERSCHGRSELCTGNGTDLGELGNKVFADM